MPGCSAAVAPNFVQMYERNSLTARFHYSFGMRVGWWNGASRMSE